jgi:hypothetical protein
LLAGTYLNIGLPFGEKTELPAKALRKTINMVPMHAIASRKPRGYKG